MPPDSTDSVDDFDVELRDPNIAALLAWIWPGAGHFYQRRYAKGVLFMVCILGAYFFGLALGGGHVVYASWSKTDWRWQYVCQLGVGAPAMPAMVQSLIVSKGGEPITEVMAPPSRKDQPVVLDGPDRLADWNYRFHSFFELGTLYTVVAGLLNVLAIYDAFAGPVRPVEEEEEDEEDNATSVGNAITGKTKKKKKAKR